MKLSVNKDYIKKLFSNKKVIIGAGALLIVIFVGVGYKITTAKNNKANQTSVKYTTLKKTNIATKISSSGAIQSDDSTNIYSNLEYNVATINVKVGDVVKKGDIIATIDTTDLEQEISQLEQSVKASEEKNKLSLESAKLKYDNLQYLYDNNLNTSVINAEKTLDEANLTLESESKNYEYNKALYESGEVSKDTLNNAQMNYNAAKNSYDKAAVALESAKVSVDQALEEAKTSYESARATADNKSDTLSLENKKDKLNDAQVIATVDGTITNVNCEVGVKASGALFVIQNLDKLKVDADVDETDINQIQVGQRAEVTTDASGNEIIQGEVTIAEPVSTAASESVSYSSDGGSSGSSTTNTTSSDVTFTVEIQLSGQSDKVKLGMNSVVNIITNEKSDIYSVPYGAVINNNGENSVYVAVKKGNEYTVEEISVTKGIESDTNVEIDGADLSDGMIILSEPSNYTVGSTVTIK